MWHDARSPYRVIFEIEETPADDRAGVLLRLPICGLGLAEGQDAAVFDANGRRLQSYALGRSTQETALVHVQPRTPNKHLFAYFGSKRPRNQSNARFRPPLLMDVRTLPDGPIQTHDQVESLYRRSERIGVVPLDTIFLAHNLVDTTEAVLLEFTGVVRIPQTGQHTVILAANGAGFLSIDGKLVLARGGLQNVRRAASGSGEETLRLQQGDHTFRLLIASPRNPKRISLGYRDGKKRKVFPPERYAHAGAAKRIAVEARHRPDDCPLFTYRLASYIGLPTHQYTEVICTALNGNRTEWRFADGTRLEGSEVRYIAVGLEDVPIRARQGKVWAQGALQFPEAPPRRAGINRDRDFRRYRNAFHAAAPEGLATPSLVGRWRFIRTDDMDPDLPAVCLALLERKDLPEADRTDLLADLSRTAAIAAPDVARKAHEYLLRTAPDDAAWQLRVRYFAEFAMLALRDFELAATLLEQMRARIGSDALSYRIVRLQYLLQTGKLEPASSLLLELENRERTEEERRRAAVRARALEQHIQECLRDGFVVYAQIDLYQWAELTTDDWRNGALPLARARVWRRLGWHRGALAELDAAKRLNPLLPNLPDIELEQARVLSAMGEADKARPVLEHIRDEYPNHPAAKQAAELLETRPRKR